MKKTKLTKKLEEKYAINSMIDFVEGLEKTLKQEFEEQKLEKWVGLMLHWPEDGKVGVLGEQKKNYLMSILKDVRKEAYKEILKALYKL